MKTFKQLREASSKQVHVRMDNLGKDQKKVGDILKKYEKNGSIEFDGETDKGAIFTVKKPAAIETLNRELKPYSTSAQLGEAKSSEIKIVADTNSRKYKEGEVIKTFPETKAGLNQAMVFQKSVKDRYGIETTMVRESSDLKNESTKAYGSSLEKIRDKKKKDAISPSDREKLAKLKKMMSNEEVDPADVDDYEASDDDRKAADKNIVMQIRRAADMPKGGEIHFKDGKKFNMNQKTAKMIVKKFNAMRKPSDKEAFQNKASQSLAGLRSALGLK